MVHENTNNYLVFKIESTDIFILEASVYESSCGILLAFNSFFTMVLVKYYVIYNNNIIVLLGF